MKASFKIKTLGVTLLVVGALLYCIQIIRFDYKFHKCLSYEKFDRFSGLVWDSKPDRNIIYKKLLNAAFSKNDGQNKTALLIIEHVIIDAWMFSEIYEMSPYQLRMDFKLYVLGLECNSKREEEIVNRIVLLIKEINADPIYRTHKEGPYYPKKVQEEKVNGSSGPTSGLFPKNGKKGPRNAQSSPDLVSESSV